MKAETASIEGKVERLLVCLDKDAQYLQESLLQLDEMRKLVIKRDEAALGKLLQSTQADAGLYRQHEFSRKSIRKELADCLGCRIEQVTLSALRASVGEEKKDQLTQVKAKLRSLCVELKKEYLSTALLLSECARFNNLLLKAIFNPGRTESVQYNSNGVTRRQIDTAFVNLQI
jgi:ribosomal protein S24E